MLKTRVITAILLAIGFLFALFFISKMAWICLTFFATMIGIWEWSKLIKLNKNQTYIYLIVATLVGLILMLTEKTSLAIYHDKFIIILLSISTFFWTLLAPIWLISRKKIITKFAMSILGLSLLLATWVALIGLKYISPWLLLSVLVAVWLADSAAYFVGKRFGRHKLAPEVSPGKTWEGVAGAMLAATLYGLLLSNYMHISHWIIVGLWLIVILSILGDLFESLLKRQAGVKDSSHLLPGHGGVLDRIDGLISTLPIVLLYVYFPLFSDLQLHVR